MANDLLGNPYIVDTAAATVLSTAMLKVQSVRWLGASNAAHTAIIHNQRGKVVWSAAAMSADHSEESIVDKWWDGLIVPTLGSGTLHIQLA